MILLSILFLILTFVKLDDACTGLTMNQDTVFIMDSSSYLTSTQWSHITSFVSDVINSMTSSASTYPITLLSYGDESLGSFRESNSFVARSTAQTTLASLSQYVTSTSLSQPDAQSAINYAITELTSRSVSRRRVIVLIAGQESVLDVCNQYPRENNIFFYVVTINDGSWFSSYYDCLATNRATDSDSIQLVTSSSSLSSIVSSTYSLICPSDPIVKITEVKPESGGTGPGFVEMYNFGPAISVSSGITLTGLITGTINPTLTWNQGQYLVVYDSYADPRCIQCDCAKTGTFCTASAYIKCGSSPTYGTFDTGCSWDGGGITSWSVALRIGGTLIETITHGSGDYWPTSPNDYSYEMKFSIWDGQFGSSWARSIDQYGTPGDSYEFTDGGLTCTSGQYLNYRTCDVNPKPLSCTGTIIDDTSGSSRTLYEFQLAPYDGHHSYTALFCPNGVGNCNSPSSQTIVGNQKIIAEDIAFATTQLGLYDFQSWYDEPIYDYFTCDRVSLSPTTTPTASPTFSTPTISSCLVSVDSPTDGFFVVTWTEDRSGTPPPDGSQYYNIVLNTNNPIVVYPPTSYSRQVSWDYNAMSDAVTVQVVYEVNSITYTSPTTTCDVTTIAPTPSPSGGPTLSPQTGVTPSPSRSPTPAPTYDDIDVTSCVITIISGQTSQGNVSWTTSPDYDPAGDTTPEEDETLFLLSYPGGTITVFSFETSPALKTFSPAISPGDDVRLKAVWYINDPVNGLEYGESTVDFLCTIVTDVPSPAPTQTPTATPTRRPTFHPTPAPTNIPSGSPTQKPTFEAPPTRDCWVNISSIFDGNNTFTAVTSLFQLVEPDTNAINTPETTKIRYSFEYNGEFIQKRHNTIDGVNCIDTSTDPCMSGWTATLGTQWNHGTDYTNYPLLSVQYITGINTVQQESAQTLCTVATGSPTMAPSRNPSAAPTAAPLNTKQYIYFEVDMCDVSDTISDPIASDRCGCPSYDDCSASGDYDFAPLQIVAEAEFPTKTALNIRRTQTVYRYNITLFYTISFVDQTNAYIGRRNFTEAARIYTERISNFSYEIPEESFQAIAEEQNNQGKPGLYTDDVQTPSYSDPATRDNSWINQKFIYTKDVITANLELGIYTEDYKSTLKSTDYYLKSEIFYIEIVNCSVQPNPSEARPGDVRECELVWPSAIFVGIDDSDPVVPGNKKNVANRSWQDWFWYVLIAIALFLLILGYFAYRWWVNNKMKEAEVEEEEDKIDEHFREIEEGFGNDLGDDNVGVNPLNTDVQRMKNQGKNVMGTDTTNENTEIQDRADVRVDKINFKQEFGPNQGNRY